MRRGAKTRPKKPLYLMLEDLDFSWYEEEVDQVKEMWNDGSHIEKISDKVNREVDEVALLIIDLHRNKEVDIRDNGVYGRG